MERSIDFQPEQWRHFPVAAPRDSLLIMGKASVPAHCITGHGTRPLPMVVSKCNACSGTGVSLLWDDIEQLPCLVCGGTGREDNIEEFATGAPKSLVLPMIVVGTLIGLSLAFLLISASLRSMGMLDYETSVSTVNISAEARRQVQERLMTGRVQVEFPSAQDDWVESLGNNLFQVTSWVDSRIAGIGTPTRISYTMRLRQEDRNRWTVEGLTSNP